MFSLFCIFLSVARLLRWDGTWGATNTVLVHILWAEQKVKTYRPKKLWKGEEVEELVSTEERKIMNDIQKIMPQSLAILWF